MTMFIRMNYDWHNYKINTREFSGQVVPIDVFTLLNYFLQNFYKNKVTQMTITLLSLNGMNEWNSQLKIEVTDLKRSQCMWLLSVRVNRWGVEKTSDLTYNL